MKKSCCMLLVLCLCLICSAALGEKTFADLIIDLVLASENPCEETINQIDCDTEAMKDELALSIAENWKEVWINPEYHLNLFGEDDPALLPITGRHAFVVLGFQLKDGEMTDELKGRCNAAAAAAKVFPDSILVCTGGATGENNPENHTEAGMMKQYLTDVCDIAPERIFTDERAMDTVENARNTLEILKAHAIETMTIVTSSYHQRRGETLHQAMAAKFKQKYGYSVYVTGNFSFYVEKDEQSQQNEMRITMIQLCSILELPEEQTEQIRNTLFSKR